jgi:hypothetical protein
VVAVSFSYRVCVCLMSSSRVFDEGLYEHNPTAPVVFEPRLHQRLFTRGLNGSPLCTGPGGGLNHLTYVEKCGQIVGRCAVQRASSLRNNLTVVSC